MEFDSLRYPVPVDHFILVISVVLRKTILIILVSAGEPVSMESEILRVVSLSTTEISEMTRSKNRSSGSGYVNVPSLSKLPSKEPHNYGSMKNVFELHSVKSRLDTFAKQTKRVIKFFFLFVVPAGGERDMVAATTLRCMCVLAHVRTCLRPAEP